MEMNVLKLNSKYKGNKACVHTTKHVVHTGQVEWKKGERQKITHNAFISLSRSLKPEEGMITPCKNYLFVSVLKKSVRSG